MKERKKKFHAEQIFHGKSWMKSLIYFIYFFRQSKSLFTLINFKCNELRFRILRSIHSDNITHVFYPLIYIQFVLVDFYQYNIFFCVRKCRVLSRINVICGNF